MKNKKLLIIMLLMALWQAYTSIRLIEARHDIRIMGDELDNVERLANIDAESVRG